MKRFDLEVVGAKQEKVKRQQQLTCLIAGTVFSSRECDGSISAVQ